MSNTISTSSETKRILRPRVPTSSQILERLQTEAEKQGCKIGFVIAKILEDYYEKKPEQKSLF